MGAPLPQFSQPKLDYVQFDGGLDDVTPPLQIPTGYCRRAQNYEIDVNGGYRRIDGYERFDGQTAPSDASYATLPVTITGSYAVGDTITGVTSGETAVIAAATDEYFVITMATGAFDPSEVLNIGGSPIATTTATQTTDGAPTVKLHAQYLNAAADIYRADITAVPGSGSILGVWMLNNIVYAVRNNAGGTAAALYKQSSSGWTLVALGYELAFTSGGTYEVQEGDTITGATSTETAVVTRVVLESGSWAAGTAAGRLIYASQSGPFVAENLNVGANLDVATIAADGTAITLTINGRYETYAYNFGAGKRIYGCSGVQRGFEFDGTVYVPIATGMATDTPSHVYVHKRHLFFAFAGSAQHSGIATPYQWTILSGAAELAMGDTITGFMVQAGSEASGGALVMYTRNSTKVLYGSSSADWNLTDFSGDEQGAITYSVQNIGQTYVMDDRGITSLGATANYGNFQSSTLSQRIQKTINTKRLILTASCVSRDKNQYRLFFSDGSALYATFNGKKLRGIMPMLFSNAATCVWSGEMNDGSEAIFFGSTNGMVYQMESGTSFDGENIDANMYLVFNPQKTVRQNKQYKHCMFELSGSGYSEFSFTYELGYASTEISQPGTKTEVVDFSPAFWDSFIWDAFVWDGKSLLPSSVNMEGSAENVSLILLSSADYFYPHTFSGAILHYLPRRGLR